MSGPEVHHLFHHPIADHSFSSDRQTLAVARDNNVELFARSGSKFTLKDELKGHDKTLTGVDIAQRHDCHLFSRLAHTIPASLTMQWESH